MAALLLSFVVLTFVAIAATRRGAPRGPVVAFTSMFVSQFLLVEQSIAGIPFRVLAAAGASAYIFAWIVNRDFHLKLPRPVLQVASCWVIYMWVIAICAIANGSLGSVREAGDFVSRYGFALLALIVAARVSQNRAGLRIALAVIAAVVLANLVAGVAQVAGVSAAFQVQKFIFPQTSATAEELISSGALTSFGYTPSLSAYSIAAGLVYSCLPWVLIPLMGTVRGSRSQVMWFAAAAAIVLVGGVISLSRSTLLVGVVGLLAGSWILRGDASRNLSRGPWLVIGIILILSFAWAVWLTLVGSGDAPNASRILDLRDEQRQTLLTDSFAYLAGATPRVLFFGGAQAALESGAVHLAAHNVFANAFLYFGLFGGGVASLMYLWLVALVLRELIASRSVPAAGSSRWLALCAMGYLLKSLFHNESVVSSGILLMFILGLMWGARSEKDEYS